MRVVLIPETQNVLLNLKINKGWNFYLVILNSWIYTYNILCEN
jgi:hypothetical protein